MEGLFQILIIGLFIVASIFDAVSRNKKKQEQKERMKAEEAGEGADVATRPRPRPAQGTRASGAGTTIRPPDGPRRSKAPTGAGEGGDRTSAADELIPEDFWAILTGEAPARKEEPEPTWAPAPTTASEPSPEAEAEATTRRSSRWMEGLDDREGAGRAGGAPAAEEPVLAGTRPRPSTSPPGGTRSFPAPPPRPESPFARPAPPTRVAGGDPMAEPWGALGDISSGEIADGRGATLPSVDLYGEDGGRRRAGATDSPYVRLVASGRRGDLKSAIVLREVLGTPVGARGREDESRGWRWED